jgi:hypothetical protein
MAYWRRQVEVRPQQPARNASILKYPAYGSQNPSREKSFKQEHISMQELEIVYRLRISYVLPQLRF